MAKINLKEQASSSVTTLPNGTYQAVVSAAWDLGMQESTYEGVTTVKHKVMFRFEINKTIPDEGAFQGKRYNILKEINIPDFFGDKAALVKLVCACEGKTVGKEFFKDFDTDSLIGKNLMVATGLTSGGNAKIESFSTLMDILPVITPELTPEMPEWVAKKVMEGKGAETPAANAQPAQPSDLGPQTPPAFDVEYEAHRGDEPSDLPF
jgi:hypothetical protein